jgi:pyruvate,water dikinase
LVYGKNGKDTVNTKTDIKKQKQFVLSSEEILELARYSLIVENHYERPMDME